MAKPKTKPADKLLFGEQEVPLPPRAANEDAPKPEKAKPAKKGTDVAVAPPSPPIVKADDPFINMIREVALNPSLDVTKLDALLSMQERITDRQNMRAFDEALARMQPELPVIDRKGRIEVRAKDNKGERTGAVLQSTGYGKWEDIVEAITPILSRHGFALRYKTLPLTDKGLIKVVGVLSGHGHRETGELELQHDSTGSKNSVQSVMSSISYAKRGIGCALLNIVTRDEDVDGSTSGRPLVVGEPITAEQATQIVELAIAVKCPGKTLLAHLNKTKPKGHPDAEDVADLPADRFQEAVDALRAWEASRAARSAETEGKR